MNVITNLVSLILESRFGTWEYSIPKDKEQLLWDFYTMAWIDKTALGFPTHPKKPIEIQDENLQTVYNESREKLYSNLKDEILNSLVFAVAAEFRHIYDETTSDKIRSLTLKFSKDKKYLRFIQEYTNSYKIKYSKKYEDLWRKRESAGKSPFNKENRDYFESYKAIIHACNKSGISILEFMEYAEFMFKNANWASSFGGKKWANIAKGWQLLYNAKSTNDIEVYIDHAYDLQHNTDTVFNKLKSYYKSGYDWIKQALDKKLNLKNIYELIDKASPELKRFAYAYVHDLFGISKEMLDKKIKKEKASDKGSSVYKVLDTAISSISSSDFDYSKMPSKKSTQASKALIDAARAGNLEQAKQALLNGADPKAADSQALRWAAYHGHANCVRLLIPVSDPKAMDSWALRYAASNGHADCVRLLIPVSDPKAMDSQALRLTAFDGHADCVRLLIPVSDPKAWDSWALRWAAYYGHADCVRLLIPVSDPKAVDSWALRSAAEHGHADCVRLLIPVSDPKVVLELDLNWKF